MAPAVHRKVNRRFHADFFLASPCAMIGDMIPWARQRQIFFIAAVLLVALGISAVYVFTSWRKAPSCSNGIKDGSERGPDCGGSCRFLCEGEASAPVVAFARPVLIAPGVWGAVAYVENRNQAAGARTVPYTFKLYDDSNLLVYERRGQAYLPPHKSFALFEGGMRVGSRAPARAAFEWTLPVRFEALAPEPRVDISGTRFENEGGASRIETQFKNPGRTPLPRIEATALLFNASGTLYAASATFLKNLPAGGAAPLTFTWPTLSKPTRIEVLYTIPDYSP